jgi:hypothetical protein
VFLFICLKNIFIQKIETMRKLYLLLLIVFSYNTTNAQLTLSGTNYLQDFSSLGTNGTPTLPQGWTVRTGATASSLGNIFTNLVTTAASTTTGNFRNIPSYHGTDNNNRALAIRQTGSFGDPGAAFVFNIANTLGKTNFQLTFDLQSAHLNTSNPPNTRVTTWLVDYGTGTNPDTFTDANAQGTLTTSQVTAQSNSISVNFGTALDNINDVVWIRIVTLISTDDPLTAGQRATTAIDNFNLSWSECANPINITQQPQNQNAVAGQDLVFEVGASSSTTINYQWEVSTDNGVSFNDISGETNSTLNLTNVSLSESDNLYRVILANNSPSCQIISDAALLTVSGVRFVTQGGTGDGSSWVNASGDLQAMINASSAGDNIFVADGTFKPNRPADNLNSIDPNNRNNAFVLKSGVKIYGGFNGTESSLAERVLGYSESILSGNIGNPIDSTDNCYHVVIASGLNNQSILDGFTVTDGNANGSSSTSVTVNSNQFRADLGGGIFNIDIGNNLTVSNCKILNNSASSGGGIYNRSSSSPIITNTTIAGNSASGAGGGIYNIFSSSPIITNTTIAGNSAISGGGIFNNGSSSPIITNTTIAGNIASAVAGGIYNLNSSPIITNTTIAGNRASSNNGGIYSFGSSPTLNNTIVWGNSSGIGGSATVSNSIVQGGFANCNNCPGGNGNIDPLFVNLPAFNDAPTTAGNFSLQCNSPAINAGSNTLIPTGITTDIIGQNRIKNDTVDIGAYEVEQIIINQQPSDETIVAGQDVSFEVDASPSSNISYQWQVSIDGGSTFNDISSAANATLTLTNVSIALSNNVYRVKMNTASCELFSDAATLIVNGTRYVTESGTGDGSSWTNASNDLQLMINNSVAGDTIFVAGGIYKPNAYPPNCLGCGNNRDFAFSLKSGVKIYGGFNGTESSLAQRNLGNQPSILSGDIGTENDNSDNCYHVVIVSSVDNQAEINGFTITGGNANGGISDIYLNVNENFRRDFGGGIIKISSSLTISNITLIGNNADYGGGIFNISSSPTISNTIITGNNADLIGGGIVNHSNSSPIIINTIITGNNADTIGGGIVNVENSSPIITNTTIAGNKAPNSGGIYNLNNSNPIFNNTIVWGNSSNELNGSSFNNSIVQGGFIVCTNCPGGNGDIDPLFVNLPAFNDAPTTAGDFSLQCNSPAINAGNNDSIPAGITTDIIGQDRIKNGTVDIGAYEVEQIIINQQPSDETIVAGQDVSFEVNASSAEPITYQWQVSTDGGSTFNDISSAANATLTLTNVSITLSNNVYRVVMNTTSGCEGISDVASLIVNGTRYVTENGTGDGSSWANASNDLQLMINNSFAGDSIFVASGTYKPNAYPPNCVGCINNRDFAFSLKSGIRIYGGFNGTENSLAERQLGNQESILSGDIGTVGNNSDNCYHVVIASSVDNQAEINGFTITGGNANAVGGVSFGSNTFTRSQGAGIFNLYSSPNLANMVISGNNADFYGGGILNRFSTPSITNTSIVGNNANQIGGGIYNFSSSPIISNTIITGNNANRFGGGIYNSSSSPTISKTIISENNANQIGGGIYNSSSSPIISNTIITGNFGSIEGGGIYNSNSSPIINNSTIAGNMGGGIINDFSSPTLNNTIVWGNSSNTLTGSSFNNSIVQGGFANCNNCPRGNGDIDPLFVDLPAFNDAPTTAGDFSLQCNSPAINAGNNTLFPTDITTDIIGQDRIKNDTIDVGAYEVEQFLINQQPSDETIVAGQDVSFEVNASSAETITYQWEVSTDGGSTFNDISSAANAILTLTNVSIALSNNVYRVKMNTASCELFSDAATLIVNGTRYVTESGNGTLDGSSWTNASNDLQAMINISITGDTIFVAEGTYVPNAYPTGCTNCNSNRDFSFMLKSGVKIYGGFKGTENSLAERNLGNQASILSGDIGNPFDNTDNCYHVVIASNVDNQAEINGFTITGGNANGTSPVIVGSIDFDQSDGSGIINRSSSPIISNITLTGNNANRYGGGISNRNSSPTITNTTIIGNNAGGDGGGIDNEDSSPAITNTTVAGNKAPNGGGISNIGSSNPTFNNTIIWGNSSNRLDGSSFHNSIVQGGFANCNNCPEGNGDINPLFVDLPAFNDAPTTAGDFSLQCNSPAINAGNNTLFPTDITTDIIGQDRIKNDTVDIGAYEVEQFLINQQPQNQSIVAAQNVSFEVVSSSSTTIDYQWQVSTDGGSTFNDISGETNATLPLTNVSIALSNNIYRVVMNITGCEVISDEATLIVNGTRYVTEDGNGTLDGSSWADASNDLLAMINISIPGDTIFVAEGTYVPNAYPTGCTNCSFNRDYSFMLKSGVKIYGGFKGSENSLVERDLTTAESILSGQLPNFNRVFHVVLGLQLDNNTVLDGFTIRDGSANTTGPGIQINLTPYTFNIRQDEGGGVYLADAAIILKNNKINSNFSGKGGAIFSKGSNFSAINTEISNNLSFERGAGIYLELSSPNIINTLISKNNSSGSDNGNSIYIDANSAPVFSNSTVAFNSNTTINTSFDVFVQGSATPTFNNTIIWGDFANSLGSSIVNNSIIFGGHTPCNGCLNGDGNIDPLFGDNTGNYKLLDCNPVSNIASPAIDAGNNSLIPTGINTDLLGDARIQNTTVNIGAYESTTGGEVIITSQPQSAEACLGDNITFEVEATGTDLTYQWYKNNNLLFHSNQATLTINNVNSNDFGDYYVEVRGLCENKTSDIVSISQSTVPPIFTQLPPTEFYVANNTCFSFIEWQPLVNVENACDPSLPVSLSSNFGNFWFLGTGNYNVDITATDNFGNQNTVTHSFSIIDNVAPTITSVPNNVTITADANTCEATYSWNPPIVSDNCVGVSMTSNYLPGSSFPIGTTTVTYTATDASGNTANVSFEITVESPLIVDLNNPVIAYLDNNGQATLTESMVLASPIQSCAGVASVNLSNNTFECDDIGNNVFLTIVVTDLASNTSSTNVQVIVLDTISPALTVNAQTVDVGITLQASSFVFSASDNCTNFNNLEFLVNGQASISFSCNDVGSTLPLTVSAEDENGNTTFRTTTVTVEDNEAPDITCNSNETISTNAGVCSYTHNGTSWDATANDNCSIASIGYSLTGATTGTGTSLNGVTFNLGVSTVTWTSTDGSGNTDVCSFTVIVEDNEAPVITCITNQTISTNASVCSYTHNGTSWDASANDNCSIASIEYNLTGATTGTGTSLDGVIFNLGVSTVTWTSTDGSGNTDVCSFTVTVEDNQAPDITCITNQTISTNAGVCSYTHNGTSWDATANDNCSIASIEYSLTGATTGTGTSLNGVTFNLGVSTVTWTSTDGSGNTDVCSFTVTVEDNQAPDITCITNQTISTNAGVCSYTHNGTSWDASANDNCSIASIEYSLTGATTGTGTSLDGVIFNLGVSTVTWTSTDGSGNTDVCSFTVTVEDNQAPDITCITNQTISTNAGVCSYTHNGTSWDATANDNCSIASIEYSLTGATTGTGTSLNGVTFNLGVSTVTWTSTDGSGNTDVCNFTVTVEDNEAPVIACNSNQTISTNAGLCSYTHNGTSWDATANDNCSIASIEYSLTGATTGTGTSLDGVTFNLGVSTVTWTSTDGSGNTDVCSFTVTVEDNEAPVISCNSHQTISTDAGLCGYTHNGTSWDASANDNCSISSIEYSLTGATTGTGTSLNGVTFNLGVSTVTWTSTDGSGNTDVCSFTVTVEDNEAPVISCNSHQTISTDAGLCGYTHNGTSWDATANDNCSIASIDYSLTGATTGTGTSLNGVIFNPGVSTVTWTSTDGSGNTGVCSFTVTVEDNEAPVIACITNQTISTNAGFCSYTHNGTSWDATANDNCSIASIEYNLTGATTGIGTSLNGVTFNLGVSTVTWTSTDGSGNTDVCSFTVTVEDNQAPDITCITNQTIITNASVCSYTHNGISWDASANDNCSIASIEYNLTGATSGTGTSLNGVTFNLGVSTVTWTSTDGSGNTDVCSFTVTVEDNQAPDITCITNQTIITNASVCSYTHNGISWDASANDNCSIASIEYNLTGATSGTGTSLNGVTFNLGVSTVTWTSTDGSGNTDVCNFTVTVEDNIAPTVITKDTIIYLDNDGLASITASQINNSSFDNCGIDTLFLDKTDFGCLEVGFNTVILTVVDEHGNSSTGTAIVQVLDTIAPVVDQFPPSVYYSGASGCSRSIDWTNDIQSSDNCTPVNFTPVSPIFLFDLAPLQPTDPDYEMVFTLSDNNGNSRTYVHNFRVLDTISPIIANMPSDITLSASANACGTTYTWTEPTRSDNCPGVSMSNTGGNPSDFFPIGSNLITYTATDVYGNSTSRSFTITVVDDLAPVISPQNLTAQLDASGNVSIQVSDVVTTPITDNCFVQSTSVFPNTFNCSNLGLNTVTITAEDSAGNISTATAQVTVVDNLPPVIVAQGITLVLDSNGETTLDANTLNISSTDNCPTPLNFTATPNTFDCSNLGNNNVVLSVSDAQGNTSTTTVVVVVEDNESPIALAQNITVSLDNNGNATITPLQINNNSTDNCQSSLTFALDVTDFTCLDLGDNNVILTVTDGAGNSSTASAVVTVEDNLPPTAIANILTVALDYSGTVTVPVASVNNNSIDNCVGTLTFALSDSIFDCTNLGNNFVSFTATDASGNSGTTTALINVIDTLTPIAQVKNITVQLGQDGTVTIAPEDVDSNSVVSCGIPQLSLDVDTFDCNDVGTNTVILSVTDASNNVSTASAVVTVLDTVFPTAISQDITVYLDNDGLATITANDIDNGSDDNCAFTLSIDNGSFDCNNVGTNTVILSVTDASNNVSTASAIVTVLDTVSPTAIAQDITVYLDNDGEVSITANDIDNGSDDNCSFTLSIDNDSFDCNNVGTNTVILSVTDASNNVSTASAVVTVLDTVLPTAIAQDITVYLDNDGLATITANDIDNGSDDNCAFILSIDNDSFDCNDAGTNTVILSVTDASNNISTASAVVTVLDTVSPTMLVQNFTLELDSLGIAVLLPSNIDNGSNDACGIDILFLDNTNFDCSDLGINTVVLTAIDNNGNSNSATATVNVVDVTAPVATSLPPDTLYLDASSCNTLLEWRPFINTFDACSPVTITSPEANFLLISKGVFTLNFLLVDNSGNARPYSHQITVLDTISPSIVGTPSDITVSSTNINGNCGAIVTWNAPTASDNCPGTNIIASHLSGSFFPIGTTTVSYTATDAVNNVTTTSFDITVVDTTAPVIVNRPDTLTLYATINSCGVVADWTNIITTDNCSATLVSSPAIGDNLSLGFTTVTFTATDVNNNVTVENMVVNVLDTISPVIVGMPTLVDLTIILSPTDCEATVTWVAPTATDNCSASLTSNFTSGDVFTVGTHTLTYTATDASGNTTTESLTFEVEDNIAPTITNVPADITLVVDSNNCGATVTWASIQADDNCAVTNFNISANSGNIFPVGSTTVNITATDAAGNTTTASFTITVIDTIAPIATTFPPDTLYLDNTSCNTSLQWKPFINTFDVCDPVTINSAQADNLILSKGTHTINFTLSDANGNTNSYSHTVAVVDTIAPIITGTPSDITVSSTNINGNCGAIVTWNAPTASDNCPGTNMIASHLSGSFFPIGTTTVSYTATDAVNNVTTTSFDITIVDTTAPVIVNRPDTLTLYATINSCGVVADWTNITTTDNCSATLVSSPAIGDNLSLGFTTVTFTATDVNNNVTVENMVVNVLDTISPVILGMPTLVDLTIILSPTDCEATVTWVAPTTTDNCSATITGNFTSGDVFTVGTHTLTYTATDASGNTTTESLIFEVEDNIAPSITNVPADITVSNDAGICGAVVNWSSINADDNCSVVNFSVSANSGDVFPIGNTTVNITATDAAGNTTTASFTITVEDIEAPFVTFAPSDIVLGSCDAIYTYDPVTATDNCGNVTITQLAGLPSGASFPVGDTENIFEVSDAAGNVVTVSFTVTLEPAYLPNLPLGLKFCQFDNTVDLSLGQANLTFEGLGVMSDGITFNPSTAAVGNNLITYTFTDSLGCVYQGQFGILINPNPIKPTISQVTSSLLRVNENFDTYQWYRDGNIIPAPLGTQQNLTIIQNGVYTVRVSNNFSCDRFSDQFPIGVGVFVGDEFSVTNVEIFPVPSRGIVNVIYESNSFDNILINVFDLTGKIVYKEEFNGINHQMNLEHLAGGTYVVRFNQGKNQVVKRLIINK